jgi:hypothetical protein
MEDPRRRNLGTACFGRVFRRHPADLENEKAASTLAAFCSLNPIGSSVAPSDDGSPSVSFEWPFAQALSSLQILPS